MISKKSLIILGLIMTLLIGCSKEDVMKPFKKDSTAEKEETEVSKPVEQNKLPPTTLKKGDKGQDVKDLQEALIGLGYELETTCTFDQDTVQHVKDFQGQAVEMAATGIYDDTTKQWLKKANEHAFKVEPGSGISEKNITTDKDHVLKVGNPKSKLVLVNKNHALPDGYEPPDLKIPDVPFPFDEDIPKKYMRKEAADALEDLFQAAQKDGYKLYGQSGYRSYKRQVEVFKNNANQMGEKKANQISARPGESEHQTGLTIDITSENVQFTIEENFGDTDEGKWVRDHAHEHGFIIRYLKGKEDITGYSYEPWHIRYVGKDVAKVIHDKDITLEEYLGAN